MSSTQLVEPFDLEGSESGVVLSTLIHNVLTRAGVPSSTWQKVIIGAFTLEARACFAMHRQG